MNGVLSHLNIPRKEILAGVGRGERVSKVFDVKYYFQSEQSIQNHSILNRGLQSFMGSFFPIYWRFFSQGHKKALREENTAFQTIFCSQMVWSTSQMSHQNFY